MSHPLPDPPEPAPGAADEALEDLLNEALEQFEVGGPAALEAVLAREPATAPRLRQRLDWLGRIGLLGAGGAAGSRPYPERLGDFRILDAIGHGGMGVVYRAVQESLQREVALKLIRPDQMYFPGARERFCREVALVARLQHPGIVPVYAVGDEAGVPYFAMELVRGATLADVIERLADRRPRDLDGRDFDRAIADHLGEPAEGELSPLFRAGWTDVVLRIGRELAEALEHAHRRGVLHRDVKPSNVLVTRGGRVLLLDFGLAGGDRVERITRTGSALGSLPYMPPELLAGQNVAGDARGDVYSLGATLWELLALRLPYQDSDPVRLRELAGSAARPKLASINPTVSWDVETVIATALEPDSGRRYASALLFARDLDNLLARRPIEARKAGPWLRLRRWAQRHPALATAAAMLLLLFLVAPTVYAVQEARARSRSEAQRDVLAALNRELDAAKVVAETASARAQANFDKLQLAVDTMLTKVGDESLRDIPRMEVVRRELLTEALRFYEEFLGAAPDDAHLQYETARVRMRTADVHGLLGNYAAAQAQVALALATLQQLAAADPGLEAELAQAHSRLATARRLLGDLPGAAAACDDAIAAWRPLAAAAGTAQTAIGLASARIEASLIAADRGDLAAATNLLDASLGDLRAWQAAHPGDTAVDQVLARTLDRHAIWALQTALQTRERPAAMALLERAVDEHTQARALWQQLLARSPDQHQLRGDAAQNAVSRAVPLQYLGRIAEARDSFVEGVDLIAALVADFPASQRRRSELANARANLAAAHGALGDQQASLEQASAARDLFAGLLRDAPDNDEYAVGLAQALQAVAVARWFGGTPAAEVLPSLDEAAAAAERALAARPDNPTRRRVRRKVAETIAEAALDAGLHLPVAAAARLLLDPAYAPTEPLLAGALLARAAPLAAADAAAGAGVADGYMRQARELYAAALDGGATLAGIRANRGLARQWDQPGFAELWRELEAKR